MHGQEGRDAVLECLVEGEPEPEVVWYQGSLPVTQHRYWVLGVLMCLEEGEPEPEVVWYQGSLPVTQHTQWAFYATQWLQRCVFVDQ